MEIERERVKEVFQKYTDAYDVSDEKIRLKIYHTYRVADLCERIAKSENLSESEVTLAWLLGMLHDIGRFEQQRQYGTFSDADSVDHAALGADILFGKDGRAMIREFISDNTEDTLIEKAVRVHNAYRIPTDLDERTERFCHILRDADKIDILKVNVEEPLDKIYNTTIEKLKTSAVTEEVMQSFFEHHAVLRSLKKTRVDHVVGHCSLVFELVFPESLRIVKEQGYLKKLLHFETENEKTKEQFALLRTDMEKYLGK